MSVVIVATAVPKLEHRAEVRPAGVASRPWNSLATGYLLDAFAGDSGAAAPRSTEAFRSLLPAAGTSFPVVL